MNTPDIVSWHLRQFIFAAFPLLVDVLWEHVFSWNESLVFLYTRQVDSDALQLRIMVQSLVYPLPEASFLTDIIGCPVPEDPASLFIFMRWEVFEGTDFYSSLELWLLF